MSTATIESSIIEEKRKKVIKFKKRNSPFTLDSKNPSTCTFMPHIDPKSNEIASEICTENVVDRLNSPFRDYF